MAGAEGFEPPLAVLETAGLPLNLRPWVYPRNPGDPFILLDFAVRLMLPAMPAKLLQFQALRGGFLVLGGRIVPVFALGALERDNLSRHRYNSPAKFPATELEPLTGIEPVTSSLPRTRSTN